MASGFRRLVPLLIWTCCYSVTQISQQRVAHVRRGPEDLRDGLA